jgi:hypothetical protein
MISQLAKRLAIIINIIIKSAWFLMGSTNNKRLHAAESSKTIQQVLAKWTVIFFTSSC